MPFRLKVVVDGLGPSDFAFAKVDLTVGVSCVPTLLHDGQILCAIYYTLKFTRHFIILAVIVQTVSYTHLTLPTKRIV